MRIKLLRTIGKKDTLNRTSDNPASPELPFKEDGSMYVEGEVADFDAADADKLIKSGNGVETSEPVGVPKAPVFGQQPIPVTVVETVKPHATEPPTNPPGNKDTRTDNRGGATGGPPSSGDAPKGGK